MARSDKGAGTTGKGPGAKGQRGATGGKGREVAKSPAKAGGSSARPAPARSRTTSREKAPAPVAETRSAKPARDAKPTKEEKQAAKALKREQRQGRFGRRLLKIGFLRRRYIKRVLRSIEKSKAKGKRMPPELWDLSKRLDQLPPGKQAEFLEQAITAGPEAQEQAGRAMRRAAANQERLSGRGGGRYRPGMGPMPPGARRGKPR